MSCSRLFEAEAMRDGRLGDVERASYERHLASCRACADEVAALALLAERLRTEGGAPGDELHGRRERTRLLAAFDAARVEPPPGRARWWFALPIVAVAAIAIVLVRPRHETPAQPPVHADVHAADDAVWSQNERRIRLTQGSLAIAVTHPAPSTPGIVVDLPDGELEDTGTTFTVRVDDGRTTEVTVAEGSVTLKLRGRPVVALAAGESWTRTVLPPVVSIATSAASPPRSVVATAVRSPMRHPDSADDYRGAVDALDRGDNARAAAAFAALVEKYPADSRAEDAAYLRVIALKRSGDTDATRAAAITYLQQFPTGFRRAEVERLAE